MHCSWRIFELTMPDVKEKIKRMILRQDGMGAVFDVYVTHPHIALYFPCFA